MSSPATLARPVYWVAGGGEGRDVTAYFLEHGVILLGPGWPGDWFGQGGGRAAYGREARFIAPLAEAEAGDIVLLMQGYTVVAIGTIDGGYEYWEGAGRQEGWDLYHCRRVRWARAEELEGVEQPPRYEVRSRAGTVRAREIVSWAEHAAETAQRLGLFDEALPALPENEQPLPKADYPPAMRDGIESGHPHWPRRGRFNWPHPPSAFVCS